MREGVRGREGEREEVGGGGEGGWEEEVREGGRMRCSR